MFKQFFLIFGVFAPVNLALAMEEYTSLSTKPVIAIDPNCFAKNAPASAIVPKALYGSVSLLWNHPVIVYNAKSIAEEAVELSKTTKGISNVLHEINQKIKAKGYGELSQDELDSFRKIAVTSEPKLEVIELIEQMKQKNFPLLCITNRDEHEFEAHKNHLKNDHTCNAYDLFDAFVTAPAYDSFDAIEAHPEFKEKPNNFFVASERMPQDSFMKAVVAAAQRISESNILYGIVGASERESMVNKLPKSFDLYSIREVHYENPKNLTYWLENLETES